jgi:mannosyltransferase OCH1-like enzyme
MAALAHGSGIPTRRTDLMQFWDSRFAPPDVEDLIASWCTDPQFIHHRYDWESAYEFIRDRFDRRMVRVFESCAVPAMQCDVFRLCWLFEQSGVYVDADQGNRGNNERFTDRTARGHLFRSARPLPQDAAVQAAHRFPDLRQGVVCTGLMSFFNRRDPLVGALLERVAANIERRLDLGIWYLTGPGVLCQLLVELGPNHELFHGIRIHGVMDLAHAMKFVRCKYKQSNTHWQSARDSIYR